MTDLNERVVEEAAKQGEKMLVDDLVDLIERIDSDADRGVAIDRVAAYAEELNDRPSDVGRVHDPIDPEEVRSLIDDRATESPTWTETGALYEVAEGRVSVYPRNWHDELGGETDLRRYVEVIEEDADEDAFAGGGPGPGVPEQVLVDAAAVLSGMSAQDARSELERLRGEGVVSENVDQHPNPRVRLEESA